MGKQRTSLLVNEFNLVLYRGNSSVTIMYACACVHIYNSSLIPLSWQGICHLEALPTMSLWCGLIPGHHKARASWKGSCMILLKIKINVFLKCRIRKFKFWSRHDFFLSFNNLDTYQYLWSVGDLERRRSCSRGPLMLSLGQQLGKGKNKILQLWRAILPTSCQ
jgi:hypothetical protein